jgi:hypothetical protein
MREKAFMVLELFRPISFAVIQIGGLREEQRDLRIPRCKKSAQSCVANLDGLNITFWSYELAKKEEHPLAMISEIRTKNRWEASDTYEESAVKEQIFDEWETNDRTKDRM